MTEPSIFGAVFMQSIRPPVFLHFLSHTPAPYFSLFASPDIWRGTDGDCGPGGQARGSKGDGIFVTPGALWRVQRMASCPLSPLTWTQAPGWWPSQLRAAQHGLAKFFILWDLSCLQIYHTSLASPPPRELFTPLSQSSLSRTEFSLYHHDSWQQLSNPDDADACEWMRLAALKSSLLTFVLTPCNNFNFLHISI